MRRFVFILTVTAALFGGAASAGALVIDPAVKSTTPVEYKAAEAGNYVGVALVPGTRNELEAAEIPMVTTSGTCEEPALAPDLTRLRKGGLCFHGGPVMHGNETFVVVWDPLRRYFATTKEYVEQFLRDVADSSGELDSPYAVTPQYNDNSGRAGNNSRYGGACDDFGLRGGSACSFASSNVLLPGHGYPPATEECARSGTNYFDTTQPTAEPQPEFKEGQNENCLTNTRLQGEIKAMVEQMGVIGRTQPGYTPLMVLLTPTGVETCIDTASKLCSANGSLTPPEPKLKVDTTGGAIEQGEYEVEIAYVTVNGESLPTVPVTLTVSGSTSTIKIESPPEANGATGWYAYVKRPAEKAFVRQQTSPTPIKTSFTISVISSTGPEPEPNPYFCSYHSRLSVNGTEVDYVVQPWTAMTVCDDPEAPVVSAPEEVLDPKALETQLGEQLVSPLSQSQIASIVNPEMDGWFALDGSEINDDSCVPRGIGFDKATLAGKGYALQDEFNNGWQLVTDPYVYRCAPKVYLEPKFVVPSPIDQGKAVAFDGSVTPSTLVVPAAGYTWEFGDGTSGTGPSVEHTFAQGGTYSVKLTVADRGGYIRSTTQTINVLGPNGEVIAPPAPPAPTPTPTSSGSTAITAPPAPASLAAVAGPGAATQGFTLTALLIPESLKQLLRHGVALKASANDPADGVASVFIPASEARHAHIRFRRGESLVMVGRGTIKGVSAGAGTFRLRLSRAVMGKLRHLRRVELTVELLAVDKAGEKRLVKLTGRY